MHASVGPAPLPLVTETKKSNPTSSSESLNSQLSNSKARNPPTPQVVLRLFFFIDVLVATGGKTAQEGGGRRA